MAQKVWFIGQVTSLIAFNCLQEKCLKWVINFETIWKLNSWHEFFHLAIHSNVSSLHIICTMHRLFLRATKFGRNNSQQIAFNFIKVCNTWVGAHLTATLRLRFANIRLQHFVAKIDDLYSLMKCCTLMSTNLKWSNAV